MTVWIVGNGPSSLRWRNRILHPSIGCNLGVEHWDFDHVVCADRMAVHVVSKLPRRPRTTYWCKASSLPTPDGWRDLEFPGIDSGSAAIQLAKLLYPLDTIVVIGFDGVLNQDNSNTYHYHFRPKPTPERIRHRHRQSVVEVAKDCAVYFVSEQPDPQLETITHDQALEKFKKTS